MSNKSLPFVHTARRFNWWDCTIMTLVLTTCEAVVCLKGWRSRNTVSVGEPADGFTKCLLHCMYQSHSYHETTSISGMIVKNILIFYVITAVTTCWELDETGSKICVDVYRYCIFITKHVSYKWQCLYTNKNDISIKELISYTM